MTLPETAPQIAAFSGPTMVGTPAHDARAGLLAGIGSYTMWGVLPLLFRLLDGVNPVLIVAERSLWSLLLLAIVLSLWGKFKEVRLVLGDRRKVIIFAMSSTLLALNWMLYIYAIESNQVLQGSLGYFINPLVNVGLGMLLLGEKLSFWQKISMAVAAVGILIQVVAVGSFPFLAIALAVTFGLYGYLRKIVDVPSAPGLFVDTLMIAPFAAVFVIYMLVTEGIGVHADPYTLGLLMLTGPATALPLLLFAYSVQRLPLGTIGMLQYISPSLQFIVAVMAFGEVLTPIRLLSFAVIWFSLAIFTADSFWRHRRRTMVA